MESATPARKAKRSELVTIFAWINIVLGALGVLVFIMLMLLFHFLVPMDELIAAMRKPDVQALLPPFMETVVRHIQEIFAAFLALSAVSLIASVALLKRQNWARLFWIAMMALTVVWCIAGMFFQPDMSSFMPQGINGGMDKLPPETQAQMREMQAQMKSMETTMRIYGYLISLVQAGIFGWGAWRFSRTDIREEFRAG